MKHFGMIGLPLEHSFSAKLFSEKFAAEQIDAEFSLYPIAKIEELPELLKRVEMSGMNVTMPYKQSVIPYLDSLDEASAEIGAVNVIQFCEGKRKGFNTDVIGFVESIRPLLAETDRRALVLGTGGASRAILYGLKKLGVTPTLVSRSADRGIVYEEITEEIMAQHSIIINATPLGMVPQTEEKPPIPYEWLSDRHLLYDLIYNPAETLFIKEGKKRGCRTMNGMDMLLGQARAAWEIWNNE